MDIINFVSRSIFDSKKSAAEKGNGEEEKKVVIEYSFWIALSRCGVHILPATVSLVLVVLNIKGTFISPYLGVKASTDSLTIAILQLVAKLQVWAVSYPQSSTSLI